MTGIRQQQWQKILKLTQRMRELGVPNETLLDLSVDAEYARQPWKTIAEMDNQRLSLLKAFFSETITAEDAAEVADGIQQIQLIDKELLEVSQAIQKEIGVVFSRLGNAQQAVAAYQDTARP